MKKTTYTCDRCGKELTEEKWNQCPEIETSERDANETLIGSRYNLCPTCYKKFKNFITTKL